jgi:hypothetical protein
MEISMGTVPKKEKQLRARGRPKGTGKDDSLALRRVAEMLVADPTLRPMTAMKRLQKPTNPSYVHRLNVKWRREGTAFLLAERARIEARMKPAPTVQEYHPALATEFDTARKAIRANLDFDAIQKAKDAVMQALRSDQFEAIREALTASNTQFEAARMVLAMPSAQLEAVRKALAASSAELEAMRKTVASLYRPL